MEPERPGFQSWYGPLLAEEAWGNHFTLRLSVLVPIMRILVTAPLEE